MSRTVWIWGISGLIAGVVLGFVAGSMIGEGTMVGWVLIMGLGGFLLSLMWGYANEQQSRVRNPQKYWADLDHTEQK